MTSATDFQVQLFFFSKKMLEVSFYFATFNQCHWTDLEIGLTLCFYLCDYVVKTLTCFPIDIAHRLEMVRIMIQKLQCNVFMLSYRGYVPINANGFSNGLLHVIIGYYIYLCIN